MDLNILLVILDVQPLCRFGHMSTCHVIFKVEDIYVSLWCTDDMWENDAKTIGDPGTSYA